MLPKAQKKLKKSKKQAARNENSSVKLWMIPLLKTAPSAINGMDLEINSKEKAVISDFDVLNIYKNVSKLSAIESYLNMLYRPFVCYVKTKSTYNLSQVECLMGDTLYEPERHSAMIVRVWKPACCLKVYENGNVYCQGYNYATSALGIKRFIDIMEDAGYSPRFRRPKFNVVNATFSLPFPVNLEQISLEYANHCVYDLETNPYLAFNMPDSIIKFAIFPMGYVYVLLSAQPNYTRNAITFILPILYRHRAEKLASNQANETGLSSGDINLKLLWEHKLQNVYQCALKYNSKNMLIKVELQRFRIEDTI